MTLNLWASLLPLPPLIFTQPSVQDSHESQATAVAHACLMKAFPLGLKYPQLENKFYSNFLKVLLTGINFCTNTVTTKKTDTIIINYNNNWEGTEKNNNLKDLSNSKVQEADVMNGASRNLVQILRVGCFKLQKVSLPLSGKQWCLTRAALNDVENLWATLSMPVNLPLTGSISCSI